MSNDKIDDAKRTTRGAVERSNERLGDVADASDEAADRVGAVDDLERERDDIEDDYEETLRALQSNADKSSSVTARIGANVGSMYNQILADRRTFLGGMALLGLGALDYSNIREEDSDFSGHFNEGPNDYAKGDIDGFGVFGEQPSGHEAAEGKSASAVIEEQIDRPVFPEVFEKIDRSSKVEVMSPGSRETYFDEQGVEFYSIDVHYDPEGGKKNSSIKINYFNMDNLEADSIEDYGSIPEDIVASSGWRNVGDNVAMDLIQTYDEVEK